MPTAHAAEPQRAESVIVTASRFADDQHAAPTHVSVIDRREIALSPAVSIPDLLKGRAGIDSRPLYGPLGLDATVDMRGFGDSATSNTLVLIDGVRLNPVDASGIDWSAIPRESIERIEIIRGSGAVLYGDRAVGGVINIVTDKSASPYAHAQVSAGSYDYRDISLAARGGSGAFGYQAAASWAETEGWRDNNDADRRSANARLGWFIVVGSIPVALIGLPLKGFFEDIFSSPRAAAGFLLVTAVLLVLGERMLSGKKDIPHMTWTDAIVIGLFQVMALFPGVSRSGSTIVGGLSRGLDRPTAARYSFLLGIPAILGAGLQAILDIFSADGNDFSNGVYVVAFIAAGVTGYACIHWLLTWVKNHTLYGFAAYVALFSIVFLLISFIGG